MEEKERGTKFLPRAAAPCGGHRRGSCQPVSQGYLPGGLPPACGGHSGRERGNSRPPSATHCCLQSCVRASSTHRPGAFAILRSGGSGPPKEPGLMAPPNRAHGRAPPPSCSRHVRGRQELTPWHGSARRRPRSSEADRGRRQRPPVCTRHTAALRAGWSPLSVPPSYSGGAGGREGPPEVTHRAQRLREQGQPTNVS